MKKHFSLILFTTALLGAASPVYAKGNTCLFQSRGLSMSFGPLDPASGNDVTQAASAATLDADRAGDCAPGHTMVISGDGTRQLKNTAGTDVIAYSLSFPSGLLGPGNGNYLPFIIKGTILWRDYADASEGSYTDTVTISVTP